MQLSIAGPLPRLRPKGRDRRARRLPIPARPPAQMLDYPASARGGADRPAPRPTAPRRPTSSARSATCTSSPRSSSAEPRAAPDTTPARGLQRPTSRCGSCAMSSSGVRFSDPGLRRKQHQRVTSFLQRTAPDLVSSVEFYDDTKPLFETGRSSRHLRLGARPPRRPALGWLPDDRLCRGADGDRHQHRQLHRARQGPARGHDHEGQRRGRRGGPVRQLQCATSAGSSSSTSSTWRVPRTATRS